MDLQERAVIVAVQLKSSTYAKDRLNALNEAMEIVSDDNVIGGTEFIDPLVSMLQESPRTCTQEVFKVLGRIFTGKNGREFTNIFVNKIGSTFVVNTLLEPEELIEEAKHVILLLIKHNKIHITEEMIRMNAHTTLIDAGLTGKQIIIEILVELGRSSNMFRKILIFNGFIEGVMKLSSSKRRDLARCSIVSLAILMNSDVSIVNYFFEMRWIEWIEYALKTHPEHGLKVIYAFSEYPKYRKFLSTFKDILFAIKDTASIFLLSYTETVYDPQLIETISRAKSVSCPCKLNFIMGAYSNYFRATQLYKEEEIGTIAYFGIISNYSVVVDDLAITTFLTAFSSIHSMELSDSLVFLKTSISIALKNGSSLVFLPEILLSLREYLQNDSLLLDLRVLISFWLLLGYIHHKDKTSFLDSIFRNFYETVFPLSLQFLASLTNPSYNPKCQEGVCNRCYYLQLTAPNVIPHSISLLTQLLWMPTSLHTLILSKFSLFLSYPQEVPLFPVTSTKPEETKKQNTPKSTAASAKPTQKEPPAKTPSQNTIFDL